MTPDILNTLIQALLAQCGTKAKALEILEKSWDPEMTSEDKDRLRTHLQAHIYPPRTGPLEALEATVRDVLGDGQTRTIRIYGGDVEVYEYRVHEHLSTPWRDVRCRSLSGHAALCTEMQVGAVARELVLAQHPSRTWPIDLAEEIE